jgi:hypothetical protein
LEIKIEPKEIKLLNDKTKGKKLNKNDAIKNKKLNGNFRF